MRDSFDKFWPLLLESEGGFDTDPHDPGNWTGGKVGAGRLVGTKYGIDAASHWSEVDIPTLTQDGAKAIYRRSYWAPILGDDLQAGIDTVTFDPAVNNGVGRAVRWLQAAVGVDQDGRMGHETLTAQARASAPSIIKAISQKRLGFDQGLGSLWSRYGKGWSARIAKVEAFSVRLAMAAVIPADKVPTSVEMHGKAVEKQVENAKKDAGGVAGTGGVTGVGGATMGMPWWFYAVLAVLVAGGLTYALYKINIHQTRAKAYADEAASARKELSP